MNTNSVIIKCNKYGLIVILDENLPFEELIKDVEDKFKESGKIFQKCQDGNDYPRAVTDAGRGKTGGGDDR